MATSLAKQGDPEPLRQFIANAHPDDRCELAGLHYWAYWVGELPQQQSSDLFMTDTKLRWSGHQVFRHLADRLDGTHAFIDLNIHSLWSLLTVRSGLARDNPEAANDIVLRGTELLDEDKISKQSRHELACVIYGLRMDGIPGKGTG